MEISDAVAIHPHAHHLLIRLVSMSTPPCITQYTRDYGIANDNGNINRNAMIIILLMLRLLSPKAQG